MKQPIIVIEGTDGCGKGTQTQALFEELINQNIPVYTCSFPNYKSRSSEPVKMYLEGELGDSAYCLDAYQASQLFTTDRLCTYKQELEPIINAGYTLLLDRWTPSNIIHQCSKIDNPLEKMKFIKWIENLEYDTLKLPRPNLVFFLDMPIEKSLELARSRPNYKSGTQKDIHEEDSEYMRKSYENGLWVANKLDWEIISCVDKNGNIRTIEDIHNEITQKTLAFLTGIKSQDGINEEKSL